jgi:hypothetical protein
MEQSPWEPNSHSSSQDIPRLVWNPKAHHRVYMSPPLVPVLSRLNQVRILTLCSILMLSLHLYPGTYFPVSVDDLRGCVQKFPDWPPVARTANGIVLCHLVQLYRYSVSQSSGFCRHNLFCCFSTSVYCCKHIFRYLLSPETFGCTLVCYFVSPHSIRCCSNGQIITVV